MGPYARVDYNLTLCPLLSRLQHIYHGQTFDLNPMPDSISSPSRDFGFGFCYFFLCLLSSSPFLFPCLTPIPFIDSFLTKRQNKALSHPPSFSSLHVREALLPFPSHFLVPLCPSSLSPYPQSHQIFTIFLKRHFQ